MPMSFASDQKAARTSATLMSDHLSQRDFRRLAEFIQSHSGIKMPPTKKTMVEGRLRRRISAIGAANFGDYCHYLFERGGLKDEYVHLIDAISTNKTEFFREPDHFRYLEDHAVPELLTFPAGRHSPLKIWSAASSIGAEPYTLAMVLTDLIEKRGYDFRFSIEASDISTRVLKTGAAAIYPEDMIAPVPLEMRSRYLLRAKDRARRLVRIVPELRDKVRFHRINLMEPPYPLDRNFDIVFCRNILIYFDKATQQTVLERICDHLRPGGYLFLGHSESLAGLTLPLLSVGTTIFRRAKETP